MESGTRAASHAGSWYTDNAKKLNAQMDKWLADAKDPEASGVPCRGIIGPHAGFSYSGPTSAYAYKYINPKKVKRIFIMGPSHHHYTDGCELTACKSYETPLGNIPIDTAIISQLYKTGKFEMMDLSVDEEEHSIELHLPYIAKIMEGVDFTLVPILVGSLSAKAEKVYGEILAPFMKEPENFFVISSDFCHWGSRFRYTWYDKSCGEVWQSIEALDRKGMSLIESLDPKGFTSYLKTFRNTICGRHPIGVFLNAIIAFKDKEHPKMKFVHYSQSSKVRHKQDSSVSYAAAVCHFCSNQDDGEQKEKRR
eukprot:jgi/Bigna1/55903/estExt_Genewise1Plus.C_750021